MSPHSRNASSLCKWSWPTSKRPQPVTGQTTNVSAIGLTAWSPNCSRRPLIRLWSWRPSWRPKLGRSASLPIMVAMAALYRAMPIMVVMAALYRATPVEHLLGLSFAPMSARASRVGGHLDAECLRDGNLRGPKQRQRLLLGAEDELGAGV